MNLYIFDSYQMGFLLAIFALFSFFYYIFTNKKSKNKTSNVEQKRKSINLDSADDLLREIEKTQKEERKCTKYILNWIKEWNHY